MTLKDYLKERFGGNWYSNAVTARMVGQEFTKGDIQQWHLSRRQFVGTTTSKTGKQYLIFANWMSEQTAKRNGGKHWKITHLPKGE